MRPDGEPMFCSTATYLEYGPLDGHGGGRFFGRGLNIPGEGLENVCPTNDIVVPVYS